MNAKTKKQQVFYEWVIEGLDSDGDIVSVDHADTFKEAMTAADNIRDEYADVHVGLVREDFRSWTVSRCWAYIKDQVLPEHVFDAYGNEEGKVPQKYQKEVFQYFHGLRNAVAKWRGCTVLAGDHRKVYFLNSRNDILRVNQEGSIDVLTRDEIVELFKNVQS